MDRVYSISLLLLLLLACQNQENKAVSSKFQKISGKTMGTSYNISYQSAEGKQLQPEIDALLKEINLGLSTYIPESAISKFNQAASEWSIDTSGNGKHFYTNIKSAETIFHETDGAFDPTVMPLVNYWGFGYTEKRAATKVDSAKVDSLLQLIGFDKLQLGSDGKNPVLKKVIPGLQLDLSGIAKGYGVDEVGRFLESQGIRNYLVDIGGEVRAKGVNKRGIAWQLGINTPLTDASIEDYLAIIELDNCSMATSGNYRNFHEVAGVKYAHTIHPKTGYPERNTLLSATVLAKECMIADGLATAFMVMGLDKAYEIAISRKELEAYFLYSQKDGTIGVKHTNGLNFKEVGNK